MSLERLWVCASLRLALNVEELLADCGYTSTTSLSTGGSGASPTILVGCPLRPHAIGLGWQVNEIYEGHRLLSPWRPSLALP
jgi:hypothetical protein